MANRSEQLKAAKAAAEAAWIKFEPCITAYAEGRITAEEYLAARVPVYFAYDRVYALRRVKEAA